MSWRSLLRQDGLTQNTSVQIRQDIPGVVLAFREGFMFILNDLETLIAVMHYNGCGIDEIVNAVMAEYDTNTEQARVDVESYIEALTGLEEES